MRQLTPQGKNKVVTGLFVVVFLAALVLVTTQGGETIRFTDTQGVEWQMITVKGPPLNNLFNKEVEPGPPLTVGVRSQRRGSQMLLNLVLRGQAGETYAPRVMRAGRYHRTPAPSFTAYNRAGEAVGSGKFQFG